MSEEIEEEKSSYEIMQEFIDEEKIYNLEGSSAIDGLNKICSALGYTEQHYRNGTSLEEFLRDNSGCCQAIIDWITKFMDKNEEWKEALSFEDSQGNEDEDNDREDEAAEQEISDLMEMEGDQNDKV